MADEYAEKIDAKLGSGSRGRQVGRMLGIDIPIISSKSPPMSNPAGEEATNMNAENEQDTMKTKPKLGSYMDDGMEELEDDYSLIDVLRDYESEDIDGDDLSVASEAASEAIELIRRNVANNDNVDEMEEEDMIDAVARALAEKDEVIRSRSSSLEGVVPSAPPMQDEDDAATPSPISESTDQTTSGVGGSWSSPNSEQGPDAYQPKVSTWGAFPRPRNISVAYGGGKRVGAGVKADEKLKQQSIDSTKERLRAYREKMGIEVQSEKDYADVIEEALLLAGRAMQRGSYAVGVSALEKVTQYCSTRSKLGGKVFLELAMAYEAEGKTDKAIGLYATLTKSPIEEIKMNADKLLYGLEAINFMRNEAKLEDFSRKKAADTFIDATGFRDMTQNFDKVYNTAYIDLDKGSQYYKMLTENVVRSTREARQILLKAVSASEVERMKVVQALRSISRHFDDYLILEKKNAEAKNVPVDYAGRPIVSTRRSTETTTAIGLDGFVLSEPTQMLNSLNGEWRLQVMANKKGDGVDFFNNTLFWQKIDTSSRDDMAYISGSPGMKAQSGTLNFNGEERILSRDGMSSTSVPVGGGGGGGGGGLLSMFFGGAGGSAAATAGQMIKVPQQVLSVDSALLITRAIVKVNAIDNVKSYYSVWRRVEPGTYNFGDKDN